MSELRLGEHVPNFILHGVDGEPFLLETHQENHNECWHLIVFFRGSWSPECLRALKEIENHLTTFTNENVTVMAIAAENAKELKWMAQKENLTFPILADEFLSIVEAFGVFTEYGENLTTFGEPAYFLIDHTGRLLYQQKQTGPFGRPCANDLMQTVHHLKGQPQTRNSAS